MKTIFYQIKSIPVVLYREPSEKGYLSTVRTETKKKLLLLLKSLSPQGIRFSALTCHSMVNARL